jgi:hypothetical protein
MSLSPASLTAVGSLDDRSTKKQFFRDIWKRMTHCVRTVSLGVSSEQSLTLFRPFLSMLIAQVAYERNQSRLLDAPDRGWQSPDPSDLDQKVGSLPAIETDDLLVGLFVLLTVEREESVRGSDQRAQVLADLFDLVVRRRGHDDTGPGA